MPQHDTNTIIPDEHLDRIMDSKIVPPGTAFDSSRGAPYRAPWGGWCRDYVAHECGLDHRTVTFEKSMEGSYCPYCGHVVTRKTRRYCPWQMDLEHG